MYKKILFDLDNTLVDDNENRKYAIRQILLERDETAIEEKAENFVKFDDQFWKDRAARKIKDPYEFKSKEEKTEWIRAERFIRYFGDISFEEGVNINHKYLNYLKEYIVPIKDAQEIIKYLFEKQYEIYIITNGPKEAVNNKLEKINIKQYIKDIFTAEEAGYMKPHNEFFEAFFNKLGNYNKDEMLIIGDEIDKDVLGGINNGIDSCWFNNKNEENKTEYKPNYEIKDLMELKNVLMRRKEWER